MQHPAEYEAGLRAERERYVMYGQDTADIDAELDRIGATHTPAPLEDAAESTPREQAVPAKRAPGRRKES